MRDRLPLILIGGLLFCGFLGSYVLQGARRADFADQFSTYRSEESGTRALYLLAEESGVEVARMKNDLEHVPANTAVVLLGVHVREDFAFKLAKRLDAGTSDDDDEKEDEKTESRGANVFYSPGITDTEAEKLLEHVRVGNTVIYAPPREGQDPFLDGLHVRLSRAEKELEMRTLSPALPTPWTLGAERVEAHVAVFLDVPEDAVPLLVDPALGETVAALVPFGAGQVIVFGAPESATNAALARADNAQLWLSLLRKAARGGRVLIDEYHHGFTSNRSIGEFARRYGLHFAAAQLLLGLMLWAAALRRFGRPRPPDEESRVASTDALFAASRIYREGKHWHFAATQILRELCTELAVPAGLPVKSTGAEIVEALQARGRTDLATALQSLLQRQNAVSSDSDLQKLARGAAELRARVRPVAHSHSPAVSRTSS